MRKGTGVLLLGLALTGCATARVEEIEPGEGGIITLQPAQSDEAKTKAKALMADNCGSKKYKIIKEGYVVVGSDSTGSSTESPSESRDLFSNKKTKSKTTNGSTSTRDAKEWQIKYKCI